MIFVAVPELCAAKVCESATTETIANSHRAENSHGKIPSIGFCIRLQRFDVILKAAGR